jgi:hypothetical protein
MSKPTDAAALRLALERGAAAELVHAPDATLAAHLPGLTLAAQGADQIAATLDRLYPGPVEVLDFQSEEFVTSGELVGVDVRLEFPAQDGVSRRVHWLQLGEDGSIRNHLVLPAQPRRRGPGSNACWRRPGSASWSRGATAVPGSSAWRSRGARSST